MKVVNVDGEKYLRLEDVSEATGIKRSALYLKVRCKEFPKPENMNIRALWKLSDIQAYIESQKQMNRIKEKALEALIKLQRK